VNTDLSPEAAEYGVTVRRALEAAGGDQLAAAGAGDGAAGAARAEAATKVLGYLGAWDLDPRAGTDELEAAAALCRSTGWWAVRHPVAERLARPRDVEADALVVVAGDRSPAAIGAPVAGLPLRWVAVDLDGRRSRATPQPSADAVLPGKGPTAVPLDLAPLDDRGAGDVAFGLVLPCWTLLGMLDRAVHLTADHVRERHQFGQPLSAFQGVQFQLTDAEVERVGVEELAKHALWSIAAARPDAVADALALRLAAVEASEVVFRITHQLHGAIGFCDETALSWLSRASQPLRRLPLGPSATRAALTGRLGRRGLSGLFS
jgi:3-oxo-4-pregnene-20-carboxyl-CoA dehydrogenase alpha subunit